METIHSDLKYQNILEVFELVEFSDQTLVSVNGLSFRRLNEGLYSLANFNHFFQSVIEPQKHLMQLWNLFDSIFLEKVMIIFVLACECNLVFTVHLIFNSDLLIITQLNFLLKNNRLI